LAVVTAFEHHLPFACQVFLKYRMNFNTIDRWKRSLLISIMKHRPIPDLIRALIVEGKSNVNIKDIYGSTPTSLPPVNGIKIHAILQENFKNIFKK
jgi:hypothetical protein